MKKAFSLIEAMCTLFIVFLLMGVCCGLLSEYATNLNFSAAKETTLSTLQIALQGMLDESRQALSFVSPASAGGAGSATLDMFIANPQLLNSPPRPDRPADLVEIRYYLSDGTAYPVGSLLRDSKSSQSGTSTSKVADSISGFSVVGSNSWGTEVKTVEITLSLREAARTFVVVGDSSRLPF